MILKKIYLAKLLVLDVLVGVFRTLLEFSHKSVYTLEFVQNDAKKNKKIELASVLWLKMPS